MAGTGWGVDADGVGCAFIAHLLVGPPNERCAKCAPYASPWCRMSAHRIPVEPFAQCLFGHFLVHPTEFCPQIDCNQGSRKRNDSHRNIQSRIDPKSNIHGNRVNLKKGCEQCVGEGVRNNRQQQDCSRPTKTECPLHPTQLDLNDSSRPVRIILLLLAPI